ncbi:hypothetical protein C8R31_101745 [Nitrosospira sp. Nsp2]|nr:hypothetical protein C8R31_101745 [Nitrosospira sp. Nsp2]
MLHTGELLLIGTTWGYRTPNEAAGKKKPWICARVEKPLTGRGWRACISRRRKFLILLSQLTGVASNIVLNIEIKSSRG